VCLVYKGIVLHKDAIVLEDYRKVFAQDFNVYFSYDAPPLRILVPLYHYKISFTSKAECSLKHLCLAL
jgi:hypothetical protein